MKILRLSRSGTDTVTFWSTPDKPGGCLLQFPHHPLVFAVASLKRGPEAESEVGLLEMDPRLYQYIAHELQGRTLQDHDIDLVSTHTEIFGVFRKGGMLEGSPEVATQLTALEARMHEENIGTEINRAIRAVGRY